ncbi:hypothetical protein T11_17106 [Trichinella zimbabwensis]|uniref:Uncharacterized protein n=1 Tax=Trichinella zimbabwensis TaxID=268475 RepID=A0A0V1GVR7_9BILA|nr:hypothetical protein T11_17106 [Trichinella zimbabwensis]
MSKLCLLLKFPRNSVPQDSSDINKRSNLKLDFKERLELPFVSIDNLTSPLSDLDGSVYYDGRFSSTHDQH